MNVTLIVNAKIDVIKIEIIPKYDLNPKETGLLHHIEIR